ncbi:MAG: hypothetical protein AAF599_21735, partial [Bacteroidota bacterium]
MKNSIVFVSIAFALFFSCAPKAEIAQSNFQVEEMKAQIIENGKLWGTALKNESDSIIAMIYDEQAHYLPNDENAIRGRAAIVAYWKASFTFLKDIRLNMETLEGTKDLLYETGRGEADLYDVSSDSQITIQYKYMNVWKR